MDIITAVQKAIDYIEDNILDELDFGDISKQACMSSYYFQRLFNIICGYSLGEYIRNRRLSLAKDELLSSDKAIVDIALKYGYDSHEGFSRAFYRYYGVTPSAARNKHDKLDSFEKISVQSILKGDVNNMENLTKRGYVVKENGSIYYTLDMDRTAKWFVDVMGWYANVDERNDDNVGTYGCATPVPGELVNLKIVDFNGIHMFYGEPEQRMVGFILVEGIDELHAYVKKSGWNKITDIKTQPWGAKMCEVTTIDGSKLRFFELL